MRKSRSTKQNVTLKSMFKDIQSKIEEVQDKKMNDNFPKLWSSVISGEIHNKFEDEKEDFFKNKCRYSVSKRISSKD